MQGLCAEKKAVGPRKRFNCSALQSIADKESANRDRARGCLGAGRESWSRARAQRLRFPVTCRRHPCSFFGLVVLAKAFGLETFELVARLGARRELNDLARDRHGIDWFFLSRYRTATAIDWVWRQLK